MVGVAVLLAVLVAVRVGSEVGTGVGPPAQVGHGSHAAKVINSAAAAHPANSAAMNPRLTQAPRRRLLQPTGDGAGGVLATLDQANLAESVVDDERQRTSGQRA